MSAIVVGDPSVFAIESMITEAYERPGQRALGYFLIHISGNCYGVRSQDASMLACSFDGAIRRVARRGTHYVAPLEINLTAEVIVDSYCGATYDESRQEEYYFNMAAVDFREVIASSEIVWAPDGDEAFDDGSHVLQFDYEQRVRLIAFKNIGERRDILATLAEVLIDSDGYYGILDKWQRAFEADWMSALKRGTKA